METQQKQSFYSKNEAAIHLATLIVVAALGGQAILNGVQGPKDAQVAAAGATTCTRAQPQIIYARSPIFEYPGQPSPTQSSYMYNGQLVYYTVNSDFFSLVNRDSAACPPSTFTVTNATSPQYLTVQMSTSTYDQYGRTLSTSAPTSVVSQTLAGGAIGTIQVYVAPSLSTPTGFYYPVTFNATDVQNSSHSTSGSLQDGIYPSANATAPTGPTSATIAISSPANGQTVHNSFTEIATAAYAGDFISEIALSIDGSASSRFHACLQDMQPYTDINALINNTCSYSWGTRGLTSGSHQVTATAYDGAGYPVASTNVTVIVR